MPHAAPNINYHVTVSDELRAYSRARNALEPSQVVDGRSSGAGETRQATIPIWSEVRLRVDGRRPVRITASEVLAVRLTGSGEGLPGHSRPRGGEASFHLYLTKDGELLGYVVASPPAEMAALPVYNCAALTSARDAWELVETSLAAVLEQPEILFGARADENTTELSSLTESQMTDLSEKLAPFFQNHH